MPRTRSRRKRSSTGKQCGVITIDENIRCPAKIAQSATMCKQHGQEYVISVREYKDYAETSELLASFASMSLFTVKKLHSRAEVEERIQTVSPYINSLQAEIDGRITHQRRFFNNNADEGHQGRIDRQQNKLDTARTLQERLGERLEELKAEDRRRELQKQARPDRGLTPRAFSDEISGCSCPTCSGERNRYGHSNTEFPTLPRCAKLASGGPLRASRQKAQYSEVARPRSQEINNYRCDMEKDYRTTAYTQYAQQEQRTTYCSTQSQPQAKTYNGGPYATTGYSSQYTPQKTNSASAYSYEASYRSQSQDWPYSRSSNPLFMPSFKKDEAPPKGKSPSYLKRFFYLSGGLLILGGMNLFNPLGHPVLTGLLYLATLVA